MPPECAVIEQVEAADILASLVDKSLVVFDEASGRYRLFEMVREYGRAHLFEYGEDAVIRDRHLTHFLSLAEEADPQLRGAQQQAWLERMETEHDNLRTAMEWGETRQECGDWVLRMLAAIWRFWLARGHVIEGKERLDRALSSINLGDTGVRANAVYGLGVLECQLGDFSSAVTHIGESLAVFRELGDRRGVAIALGGLGLVAKEQGDMPAARARMEESLDIFRELGNRFNIGSMMGNLGTVFMCLGDVSSALPLIEGSLTIKGELGDLEGVARAMNNLGEVACKQEDLPAARAYFERGLAISRKLAVNRTMATAMHGLGDVSLLERDLLTALAMYKESLAYRMKMGHRQGIFQSLEGIARVQIALSHPVMAARIAGAVQRLREDIGLPIAPDELPHYEMQVAAARTAIGDDGAFDAAWEEGRSMTMEQAIEYALKEPDNA